MILLLLMHQALAAAPCPVPTMENRCMLTPGWPDQVPKGFPEWDSVKCMWRCGDGWQWDSVEEAKKRQNHKYECECHRVEEVEKKK